MLYCYIRQRWRSTMMLVNDGERYAQKSRQSRILWMAFVVNVIHDRHYQQGLIITRRGLVTRRTDDGP